MKRGDDKTKALAKQISENVAAASSKSKADTGKAETTKQDKNGIAKDKEKDSKDAKDLKEAKDTVKPRIDPVRKPVPDPVAGVKRKVGDPPAGQQPAKRMVASGTSATASTASKPAVILPKRAPSAAADKTAATASTSAAAAKPKGHQVVAKPTNFFSSLQSASKKPGTSNAAIAAALQKATSAT